jgi:nitrogen-specific signal transduction histidine kinase
MGAANLSLLSFLEAPVLVGDPEGRAAYVNPAFESRFGVSAEGVSGQPLAALFDGGLREGMLRAVAEACERGTTARFQLHHAGVSYAAVASPIVAEDARVGVVVVLVESGATEERLRALGSRIHQSSQDLGQHLAKLSEKLASQGSAGQALVEDSLRAHGRLRAADQELQAALSGRPPRAAPVRFEPARLLSDVAERVRGEVEEGGARLELRVSEQLPAVCGEPARLASALADLLRERVREGASALLLGARVLERQSRAYVVVSLVDSGAPPAPEPVRLRQAVEELGGQLRSSVDPERGRTLAFRLPVEARAEA